MKSQKSVAAAARPIFEYLSDRPCDCSTLRNANPMKGFVDDSGRAILPIQILCTNHPDGVQVNAWIDTGFSGDFVLPSSVIDYLELEATGSIDGVLADGSQVELTTYHCQLSWYGRIRDLEVIANSGQTPLLGVGLLLATELRVDYTNLEL